MKKLYYTIGEVSKLTNVEPHVLRYWESLFSELSPAKNRGGKRVYKDNDIQVVFTLKELIQQQKYSTAGARKALKEQKKSVKDREDSGPLPMELTQDLNQVRVFLSDLLKKI
ncbi:MAG: MerR family transcriptional regulator [Balneolales bacterium]